MTSLYPFDALYAVITFFTIAVTEHLVRLFPLSLDPDAPASVLLALALVWMALLPLRCLSNDTKDRLRGRVGGGVLGCLLFPCELSVCLAWLLDAIASSNGLVHMPMPGCFPDELRIVWRDGILKLMEDCAEVTVNRMTLPRRPEFASSSASNSGSLKSSRTRTAAISSRQTAALAAGEKFEFAAAASELPATADEAQRSQKTSAQSQTSWKLSPRALANRAWSALSPPTSPTGPAPAARGTLQKTAKQQKSAARTAANVAPTQPEKEVKPLSTLVDEAIEAASRPVMPFDWPFSGPEFQQPIEEEVVFWRVPITIQQYLHIQNPWAHPLPVPLPVVSSSSGMAPFQEAQPDRETSSTSVDGVPSAEVPAQNVVIPQPVLPEPELMDLDPWRQTVYLPVPGSESSDEETVPAPVAATGVQDVSAPSKQTVPGQDTGLSSAGKKGRTPLTRRPGHQSRPLSAKARGKLPERASGNPNRTEESDVDSRCKGVVGPPFGYYRTTGNSQGTGAAANGSTTQPTGAGFDETIRWAPGAPTAGSSS